MCLGSKEATQACRNMTYWFIMDEKSLPIDILKWKIYMYDPIFESWKIVEPFHSVYIFV